MKTTLQDAKDLPEGEIAETETAYVVKIKGKLFGNAFGKDKAKALKVTKLLIQDGWYPVSDGTIKKLFKCAYCEKESMIATHLHIPEGTPWKAAGKMVTPETRKCSCRVS